METLLRPLNRGRFVVVQPFQLFVCVFSVVPPQNVEVENAVKFVIFRLSMAIKLWARVG